MSSNVTLNGVQYVIPAYNDTGWAQGAGNLSLYLAAIASNTLQPTGGAFTLTSELDFGANFGVKQLYLKTETANPASAGVIRLASADTIKWRNNANGADVSLSKDSSDNLLWATNKVYTAGGAAGIVNADIASGAAIAYSKLALTGAILNADLAGSIAYSKLVLTGAVLNADLAGSIAMSKLSALGTAKAVQTNASTGFLEASSVTNTELGYLSGVTSAIQTQFAATIANPLTGNLAAGSHKITGLSAGSTAGDSIRYEQLFSSLVTLGGNLAFTATSTQGIVGTTTNDSAAAGNVGEAVRSGVAVGSAVAGTAGQYVNITSISLTAGDWDVSAVCVIGQHSVAAGSCNAAISVNTGNTTTDQVGGDNQVNLPPPSGTYNMTGTIANYRLSLSGTTTVYLKFSGNVVVDGWGRISARRVR